MRNAGKKIFFYIFAVKFLLFFLTGVLYAQSPSAYLIPRQIYVGDPATLILPLPAAAHNREDIILASNDSLLNGNYFPSDKNIDFHRIILEQRTTGSRLMIEFTAFIPGVLEFPAIEIGGESFTGLTITVNSVIDSRNDLILSGAASTLAMPGTALMLYGLMAACVIIFLLTVWFILKGRTVLKNWKEKWKRYRLFTGIRNTEKNLQKEILKGTDERIILDELSDETKIFLSVLTGNNCRAMTSVELEMLPQNLLLQKNNLPCFGYFFRRCDILRFSGAGIKSHDILKLLDNLRNFADVLEKAEKEEKLKEEKTE